MSRLPGSTTSSKIDPDWPPAIQAIAPEITAAAERHGIDSDLFAAVIFKESYFNPDNPAGYSRCPAGPVTGSCTSTAMAIGPAQVMPFEAGRQFSGRPTIAELRDIETNLDWGARILVGYIKYMGSVKGGLAAYNCGPGGVAEGRCGRTGGYVYANSVLHTLDLYLK